MSRENKILLAGSLWALFLWLSSKTGQILISGGVSMLSDLIKKFEGFSEKAYRDTAGKLTIGYGHLIKAGENFGIISLAQAEDILAEDMSETRRAVDRMVSVPLNENQYAALVSFVFNVGSGNFANSTMLRYLNSGNYVGAGNEFNRWVYSNGVVDKGLVNRRKIEKEMFLRGLI